VGFVELEQADARLQDAVRRISLKVQTLYREIRSKELGHYQAEIDQLGEEFDHQMLAWINNTAQTRSTESLGICNVRGAVVRELRAGQGASMNRSMAIAYEEAL
jgi:hypothetical protein